MLKFSSNQQKDNVVDFENEVIKLKNLINDDKKNLRLYESHLTNFQKDEIDNTDAILARKEIKKAFLRYKSLEELLIVIANGIMELNREMAITKNFEAEDKESNLFISNILSCVDLSCIKSIRDKLTLSEQDRKKIKLESFFNYEIGEKLANTFLEVLIESSSRVLNNKAAIILTKEKTNMSVRNQLRSIEVRITKVGPSADYCMFFS